MIIGIFKKNEEENFKPQTNSIRFWNTCRTHFNLSSIFVSMQEIKRKKKEKKRKKEKEEGKREKKCIASTRSRFADHKIRLNFALPSVKRAPSIEITNSVRTYVCMYECVHMYIQHWSKVLLDYVVSSVYWVFLLFQVFSFPFFHLFFSFFLLNKRK